MESREEFHITRIDARTGERPKLPPWEMTKFVHVSAGYIVFGDFSKVDHRDLVVGHDTRVLNAGMIVHEGEGRYLITTSGGGVVGRDGEDVSAIVSRDPDKKKEWDEETARDLNRIYCRRASFRISER